MNSFNKFEIILCRSITEIKSGIKLKNNMMREETTVSYNISSISHNPLKKMENEILKNKKLSRYSRCQVGGRGNYFIGDKMSIAHNRPYPAINPLMTIFYH